MKKIVFIIVMTLFCQTMFAQVRITSGSSGFLKEQVTAEMLFDYSETTWEEDQTYKRWCGEDYDERIELSKEAFIIAFNKKSDGLKIKLNDNNNGAKYKITFKVDNIEQHAGGHWGQLYISCYGVISVQDINTEDIVCTISVNQINGEPDYVTNDRIAKCFREVGKKVASLKSK